MCIASSTENVMEASEYGYARSSVSVIARHLSRRRHRE
jgi:hypothetical protein